VNECLLLACEGGRLVRFDTKTYETRIIYQHPTPERFMGLAWHGPKLYFGGDSVLGIAHLNGEIFHVEDMAVFHDNRAAWLWRYPRKFWKWIGAHSRAIEYASLQFHQMNIYRSRLYVTVTERNEIWELDLDLSLRRKIILQPHIQDFHHINNIFFDGRYFYVCFFRYAEVVGSGGYAKFDMEWKEVERRTIGWASHALSVIDGQILHLCYFSGTLKEINNPQRAGMMINDDMVFEYDAGKYFCKDFSMDAERVYIVGSEIKPRAERKNANGVVFVLNRNYELLEQRLLAGTGGINGCRLPHLDYSNGFRS
jgi:hypothetical protein